MQICNYTDYTIHGALGYYYVEDEKFSTGWYRVRPDRCTTLASGLDDPIYLYAQTEDADKRWIPREGYATELFCVNDDVERDYYHEGSDCDTDEFDGLERWFGRVVDSNDDGYALFNVWE